MIKQSLLEIIDIFVKENLDVTVYTTQRPQDACDVVAKRMHEFDLLVCSGGDGTLDEVMTGMMACEERKPIGYIPAGSTNDFANSLHIPKVMTEAARDIVRGVPYACDIGSFNNDYFLYIAAFGAFTDVSYQTKQEMKNVLGHMAYILEGTKRIFNLKTYPVRIEHDGGVIEDTFIFGMVTNSKSVGGFKKITGPNVVLDDGVFEVTLVKPPQNVMELNEILASFVKEEMNSKYIYSFKTKSIKFTSGVMIPWTLDGENGGEHTEVHIENHSKEVEILVSPDYLSKNLTAEVK